jgi:hypothetical protein
MLKAGIAVFPFSYPSVLLLGFGATEVMLAKFSLDGFLLPYDGGVAPNCSAFAEYCSLIADMEGLDTLTPMPLPSSICPRWSIWPICFQYFLYPLGGIRTWT